MADKKSDDKDDIDMDSLDKETRDFLANTEAPKADARQKINIENGKLVEVIITGYESGISGQYNPYSRFDVDDKGEKKAIYLGSSVDQKTMARYIDTWLEEGHKYPLKIKFVRYPRKNKDGTRTYADIRAELIASGDNV